MPWPVLWTLTAALISVLLFLRYRKQVQAVNFAWQAPQQASEQWGLKPAPSAPSSATQGIVCEDPATGRLLATLPCLTSFEVTHAISKAQHASKRFNKSSFADRKIVLVSLLQWILLHSEELAKLAVRDSGKTMLDAFLGEILVTCEKLRWVIDNFEAVLKPDYRSNPLLLLHKQSKVVYEPIGLTAALVSWNYPVHNLLSPIISAIATGNTVIIKPSELVAWSSLHLAEAVRSCLHACGQDPDIVQVLVGCEAEAAQALTADERIDSLLFIGSEETGKRVAEKAGAAGTQVTLELGGKDAALLLPSVDIKQFKDTFLRAAFQSAGQNCVGIERFVVHASRLEEFISAVRPIIEDLRLGSALDEIPLGSRIDMGSMISEKAVQRAEKMLQEAQEEGASILCGGARYQHPKFPDGHYFQPTLMLAKESMQVAQQELFAPVMLVMTYEHVDEAIAIVNGTRYGLGGAVFGRDRSECERVASEMKCGMVSINDFAVSYMNQGLPFGAGKKGSGYGRFGGPEGLRSLCNVKAVVRDRLHGKVQTSIPPPLAYPIDGRRAWAFVQGLLQLAYGAGLERVKGFVDLVRA